MPFQTSKSKDDLDETMYLADDLVREDRGCNHFFVRVASNRVECKKCHAGFMDAGDFPIDELNDFYKNKKNTDYFKSI
jgi:hypothetical protein